MESTLSPNKTASAIWGRVVNPEQANLSPEAARAILKLDFDADDHRRMDELSAQARQGTDPRRSGGNGRIPPGGRVSRPVLQSKARMSLQRAKSPR